MFVEASVLGASANEHFHLKSLGSLADQLGDVSKADETKSATLDTTAVCKHSLVPLAVLEHVDAFGCATVDGEHHTNGKLRNSIGVLTWAVGNVDTLRRAVVEVDGIVTGSRTNYKLQIAGGIHYFGRDFS